MHSIGLHVGVIMYVDVPTNSRIVAKPGDHSQGPVQFMTSAHVMSYYYTNQQAGLTNSPPDLDIDDLLLQRHEKK